MDSNARLMVQYWALSRIPSGSAVDTFLCLAAGCSLMDYLALALARAMYAGISYAVGKLRDGHKGSQTQNAYCRLLDLVIEGETPARRPACKTAFESWITAGQATEPAKWYRPYRSTPAVEWTLQECLDKVRGEMQDNNETLHDLILAASLHCNVISAEARTLLLNCARDLGISENEVEKLVFERVFKVPLHACIYISYWAMQKSDALTPSRVHGLRLELDAAGVDAEAERSLLKLFDVASGGLEYAASTLNRFVRGLSADAGEQVATYASGAMTRPIGRPNILDGLGTEIGFLNTTVVMADEVCCLLEQPLKDILANALFRCLNDVIDSTEEERVEDADKERASEPSDDIARDLAELDLGPDADWGDIRTAYRALSKMFHPDALTSKNLHPDMTRFGEERFKKISEAYARLRANYQ